MSVSMWQDGGVTESQPEATEETEPLAVRTISEVESLRALADPTRLALLNVLMPARQGELPVMSVKELAAALREPQTKLYRHVKQLEAAGLIRVAATRMVSGILEQRYQARQRDLAFDSGFLSEHVDESEAALQAFFSNFRDGFFAAFRDTRLEPDAAPEAPGSLRPTLFSYEARVSPERAAEIKSKLQAVMSSIDDEAETPGDVPVSVFIGYYTRPDPEES
jgi:DNA-binding transcriptional ArsR family regulator